MLSRSPIRSRPQPALSRPPPSNGGGARDRGSSSKGIWVDQIEGRFRKISVYQLAMAWWCFQAGHITKRQLRVWFAALEMAERRRYANSGGEPNASWKGKAKKDRQPLYTLGEIKALVGGRGSETADAALLADVNRLASLGLVRISDHAIVFATSIDELAAEDTVGFEEMFRRFPNSRRSVPMPRRVVRALAAGLTTGMTAVVLATVIRSLFWHRQEGGQGRYRVDGRTKRQWIAETFGVSHRTVTDARARLIELGWLIPLETPQHMLNRYGAHDAINPDWSPRKSADGVADPPERSDGSSPSDPSGGSATPSRPFSGRSASPHLNRSLPLKGNQTTRRPAPPPAGCGSGSAGVSLETRKGVDRHRGQDPTLSRKRPPSGQSTPGSHRDHLQCQGTARQALRHPRRTEGMQRGSRSGRVPRASGGGINLRDIQDRDLRDTGRLIELYRQAIQAGLATDCEASRLDFLALAERARARGKKPAAMFYWLLREKKTAFITQCDEDRAAHRLREYLNPPSLPYRPLETSDTTKPNDPRQQWAGAPGSRGGGSVERILSEDERFVRACVLAAKQNKIPDPYRIARKLKDWSRDQWDEAYRSYMRGIPI